MGHVLLPYALECAVKKNALRFVEHGNDLQALANIDVEAASLCGVSIVRMENLMIQTQTAIAREMIKNKVSMMNDMTNTNNQIMLVKQLGKIVNDQENGFASSDVGACRARRRTGYLIYEQVAGPLASSRGTGCNLY